MATSSLLLLCCLTQSTAAIVAARPAWRALQRVPAATFEKYGKLHGSPPCLQSLEKVKKGHSAAWRVASYRGAPLDLDVLLALDRNPDEPCCKLQFYQPAGGDEKPVGFMLLGCGEKDSALRGMKLREEMRGRGLSKLLLAIWIQACREADLTPRTRVINKPLLSLSLQRLGFTPTNGRASVVEVSPATIAQADCRGSPQPPMRIEVMPGRASYVRTEFEALDMDALQAAAARELRAGELTPAASPESLRRALTLRGGLRLIGRSTRRALAPLVAMAALLTAKSVFAAKPIPAAVCDDACMSARLARKAELLRKQDRRSASDAKIIFGAEFQASKREVSKGGGGNADAGEKKIPVIGEFLLPTDVGGIKLQTGGGGASGGSGGAVQ